MKLKFLLWVALSLTFTGVFMLCGDEDVMEQVKEEEEKEDEEADEKDDEGEKDEEEEKEEIVVEQIRFSITSENTVEVAEYMDIHKYDVVIPSKVRINSKEYSVTGIADSVFYGRKDMTSIEIPSSVKSIGNSAFEGCSGLTSIKIPSSVTSIGNSAFGGCSGLTSIEIPSSVTSIGEYAFSHCENVDIVIDNSEENVTIGRDAFDYCKSVTWKR
jgi:hypothetical protein